MNSEPSFYSRRALLTVAATMLFFPTLRSRAQTPIAIEVCGDQGPPWHSAGSGLMPYGDRTRANSQASLSGRRLGPTANKSLAPMDYCTGSQS